MFPRLCFIPHLCVPYHYFLSLGKHRNYFSGDKAVLVVISVPASSNCAIFSRNSSVALSFESFWEKGRTGSFLNHECLGLVVFSFLASTSDSQQRLLEHRMGREERFWFCHCPVCD